MLLLVNWLTPLENSFKPYNICQLLSCGCWPACKQNWIWLQFVVLLGLAHHDSSNFWVPKKTCTTFSLSKQLTKTYWVEHLIFNATEYTKCLLTNTLDSGLMRSCASEGISNRRICMFLNLGQFAVQMIHNHQKCWNWSSRWPQLAAVTCNNGCSIQVILLGKSTSIIKFLFLPLTVLSMVV